MSGHAVYDSHPVSIFFGFYWNNIFCLPWLFPFLFCQFNSEPHSYTRFDLPDNMEGDTSQVEMIQSSDMNEEVGENGDEDHLSHKSNRKPHVAQNFECTTKNLCFMAATIVFTFVIGKRGRMA